MASSAVKRSIQQDGDLHGTPRLQAAGREAAAEAAAVLGRGDVECAQEGAAHRLGRAEAAGSGDQLDRVVGLLQPTAGRLEADPLDVARRCDADLGAEARGRSGAGSCRRGRPARSTERSALGVLGDPRLDLAQRVALGELGRRAGR